MLILLREKNVGCYTNVAVVDDVCVVVVLYVVIRRLAISLSNG